MQSTLPELPPPHFSHASHSAMPAVAPEHFGVPPFDGNAADFPRWMFRMRIALKSRRSWDVVDGSYPEPNRSADPSGHANWSMRDCDAQLQIALNLEGEAMNQVLVSQCATAKEC